MSVLIKPNPKLSLLEGLEEILGKAVGADAYWRIVRRIGEEPVTVLGAGDNGVAYGLPSGMVLKVTSDLGELLATNLLRGKNFRNLVRVFDVFCVPALKGGLSVGVITEEAVEEVLSRDQDYAQLRGHLNISVVLANDAYREGLSRLSSRESANQAMSVFAHELTTAAPSELTPWEQDLIPGILQAIEDLRALGIYSIDFLASNIGLIGDRPVVFDLSRASVPESAPELALGRRTR